MVNRNTLDKSQKYHDIVFEELCGHYKYHYRDLNYY